MAKNWSAYEAAREVLGKNKENIAEIGSRFPLFARTVAVCNNEYLLDILKALPKVTARVVETGLKEMEAVEDIEEVTEDVAEEKAVANEDSDYSSMTGAELYKLCCKRGISSKCKSRKKEALIELLERYDNGEFGEKEEKPKKATKATAKKTKEPEPEETEDDDWDDEEEEDSDPYAGKNAKELFMMCKERGIKAKPKQKADAYVKLLKADDEKSEEPEDEEDDDEWEI